MSETTLRDTIEAQVNALEQPSEPAPPVVQVETPPEPIQESAEQKAGRLAGRARDDKGRVLPGKVEKPTVAAPVAAIEQIQRPPRPSSWKKEHWADWDTLNPALAQYIHQREGEFSTGVSTYKAEADKAKSLQDALAPFIPKLQQHGIQPEVWINKLGTAHEVLSLGSPDQKLQTFIKLANDYKVPLQSIIGQQGQVDPMLAQLYEQVNQLKGNWDNFQTQTQQQQQAQIKSDVDKFSADKPHFEEVKLTMAGLLQSGLAEDLQSAYDSAIRMPKHFHIFEEGQKQSQLAEQEKAKAESLAKVQRARANNVSPKSATPGGAVEGKKGLRATYEGLLDSQGSGRV